MKEEEKKCLTKQMLSEDMDYPGINERLNNFKESQIVLKNNKLEISKLNKRIIKQEELISKLQKQNFNLGLENREQKESKEIKEYFYVASVNHLNRLLRVLKLEDGPLSQTELRTICCTNNKVIVECLKFAKKYNLIIKEKFNGVNKYYIK